MMQKHYLRIKKDITVFITFVMLVTVLAGCDQKISTNKKNSNQKNEQPNGKTRIVKDMVGREVEIPNKINKVFTTSPVGTIALYSINSNKIAGLNSETGNAEAKYLKEEYLELPVLGRYKDSNSGNEEEILKSNPDIIISMGNLDESWIESANESQDRLGVPFIMVDGDLENLDAAYQFLGDILGEQERCRELADYCKKTIEDTKKIASKIPDNKKKKVYYGTDGGGLTTAVRGSLHTQAIDLIGAINVVDSELEKSSSRVSVSMEQVLSWNPDVIIATHSEVEGVGAYDSILKHSKWGSMWNNIDAVKNNQVYAIPYAPFDWFDRPPSVNRVLGVRWLGNVVYPKYFNINIKKETKEFYKKFYHRELTNEEVDEILQYSVLN